MFQEKIIKVRSSCYLDYKEVLPIEADSYIAMVDCKFHEDTQDTTGTGHKVPQPSQIEEYT